MSLPDYRTPPRSHPAADLATPPDWSRLRRVLAVRPDNLGDVVLVTPALRALRAAAPQAELQLLASPAGATLRPLLTDVDGLLTISPSWQQIGSTAEPARLAAAERALVELLADCGYDAMVVFTSATQSPWPAAHAAMLAGVGVRVVHSHEFGGAVASHWVTPPLEGTHQIDRCLHLLDAVGVPSAGEHPSLRVPPTGYRSADAALREVGFSLTVPYAVLAPGASCSARRYPAAGFARAAHDIATDGLPVLVTGTAAEGELVDEVVERANHPAVRALPLVAVEALAGVIERAAVAVTNNSGCMHLADALGTPVAVAWAGTEQVAEIGPRMVPSLLLGNPTPCSPCHQFRCPYEHECLDFEPALLATAAVRLAGQAQAPSREEAICRSPSLTVPVWPLLVR
jgi:ADP-heptose:LPS heptosyltransferase